MLKKSLFWLFIIVILLVGGYFAINNEGMSLERLCYTRESDGTKICIKGDTTCTYLKDGTTNCTSKKNACSLFTNCDECTDKNALFGGRCYWNRVEKKCSSELKNGYSPFCNGRRYNYDMPNDKMTKHYMQNYDMQNSYIPVISLLPTTSFLNAATINY